MLLLTICFALAALFAFCLGATAFEKRWQAQEYLFLSASFVLLLVWFRMHAASEDLGTADTAAVFILAAMISRLRGIGKDDS